MDSSTLVVVLILVLLVIVAGLSILNYYQLQELIAWRSSIKAYQCLNPCLSP